MELEVATVLPLMPLEQAGQVSWVVVESLPVARVARVVLMAAVALAGTVVQQAALALLVS